jgi:hypothetical protein
MKKFRSLVVIVLGMVIFLGLMVFFFKKRVKVEPEKMIQGADYTQIARRTLDWIDKQRNKQGGYVLEQICDHETKTCDIVWDNKEGNKDGLIATWARLNFFEQHGDSKDLEIVKRDIDLFYDKYKDDNLKDSLWICKITYEMAQSKHLGQSHKDKLKELCMKVEYPSVEYFKNYINGVSKNNKKNESKYNEFSNWNDYVTKVSAYDPNLTILTNLVYRYLWFGNQNDKDLIDDYMEIFSDISQRGFKVFGGVKNRYMDDICLITYSVLDGYKVVPKSLDDKVILKNNYQEVLKSSLNEEDKIFTPICILLDKEINKILEDEETVDIETKIDDGLITPNREKGYGDGFIISSHKNRRLPIKNVMENGLIVNLLTNWSY